MQTPTAPLALVTIREAATALSCSQEYLRRLQKAGRLRVVRLGRRAVRVPVEELNRLKQGAGDGTAA